MKKRLFKNYVTSILGLIFAGAGLYMQLHEYDATSWGQAYLMAGVFLRSKDSIIGFKEK